MSPTNAENSTFICDNGAAELGNAEGVAEGDFVRYVLLNVEEVDRLASPFEIVDEFVRRVALLQNECVVEQFSKLVDHVNILVVCDPAGEFS